jgi:hypothetical protein
MDFGSTELRAGAFRAAESPTLHLRDFLKRSSVDQLTPVAGEGFGKLSRDERRAVVATLLARLQVEDSYRSALPSHAQRSTAHEQREPQGSRSTQAASN